VEAREQIGQPSDAHAVTIPKPRERARAHASVVRYGVREAETKRERPARGREDRTTDLGKSTVSNERSSSRRPASLEIA